MQRVVKQRRLNLWYIDNEVLMFNKQYYHIYSIKPYFVLMNVIKIHNQIPNQYDQESGF